LWEELGAAVPVRADQGQGLVAVKRRHVLIATDAEVSTRRPACDTVRWSGGSEPLSSVTCATTRISGSCCASRSRRKPSRRLRRSVRTDDGDRVPYAERAVYGVIYEARPDVHGIWHNHSSSVLPLSVTGVRLRPIMHAAGLFGKQAPVWDIRSGEGDTDVRVQTMDAGRSLAATLGSVRVVLMRGYGSVVTGKNLVRSSRLRSMRSMMRGFRRWRWRWVRSPPSQAARLSAPASCWAAPVAQ
jgi:hypothetical protein